MLKVWAAILKNRSAISQSLNKVEGMKLEKESHTKRLSRVNTKHMSNTTRDSNTSVKIDNFSHSSFTNRQKSLIVNNNRYVLKLQNDKLPSMRGK